MALTMINPASSWFEIVELPTIYRLITKKENRKERTTKEEIFDKSSDRIARLVNSLTAKCVPTGTKNSRSEDFLLAKHTSHKHPHHDVPFSRLAAWFP
jgi:hypothetical protein